MNPDGSEWVFPVDWSKVREFARAVGDDHWRDDPPVPPPTFPVVLSAEYVERLMTKILDLDRRRTVHGEQEYEYERPLRVGERVRCTAGIVSDATIEGRRGGRMRKIVCEVALSNADTGEAIGIERITTLELAPAAEGGEP
jgi:hypothetical protein